MICLAQNLADHIENSAIYVENMTAEALQTRASTPLEAKLDSLTNLESYISGNQMRYVS